MAHLIKLKWHYRLLAANRTVPSIILSTQTPKTGKKWDIHITGFIEREEL